MLQKNAVDAKAREIIFFPQPEVDISGHDSLTPSARPLACFSRPLSRGRAPALGFKQRSVSHGSRGPVNQTARSAQKMESVALGCWRNYTSCASTISPQQMGYHVLASAMRARTHKHTHTHTHTLEIDRCRSSFFALNNRFEDSAGEGRNV